MNDRLMIAAMAMQGMYANPSFDEEGFESISGTAFLQADALLAAAGEKEPGDCCKAAIADLESRANNVEAEMRDMIRDRDAQIDGLESEIAALNAEVWVHHPAVRAEYEAEIAALKRRLEPLTLKEVGGVNNPIIYGSRPLTGDEITAIVADADHIRARRA